MVVLALQPKGYAASLFYTPFDRTSLQPLKSSTVGTVHGGTLSARIVLEPGTSVFIRKECDDGRAGSSGAGDSTRLFGYLI